MKNYRNKRRWWGWVFLIVVLVLSFSLSVGKREGWNLFERIFVEIISSAQSIFSFTIEGVKGFWSDYFILINVSEENKRLRKQIQSLKLENARYKEKIIEYEQLKEFLKLKENIKYPVSVARVIGRDPSGWFKSVIINKGEKDGIKVNMPVLSSSGVVGRIVAVTRNYSQVLLIIDQNGAVDCIDQRSRHRGILKGLYSKYGRLDYVHKTADIKKGDVLITSGLGGVFPKGIPVGEVVEVKERPEELFKEVKVKLFVDFSRLEQVMVILKEETLPIIQKKRD